MFYLSPYSKRHNLIEHFNSLNSLLSDFHEDFFRQEAVFQDSALMNIYENETNILLIMECAGLKKEDINVSCDGRSIVIEWEKNLEILKENCFLDEIPKQEKTRRQITLPSLVDENSVEADYNDGILKIVLEKLKKSEVKKIDIK